MMLFLRYWKLSTCTFLGVERVIIKNNKKNNNINDIEDGGLKMSDIQLLTKALKISWIKRLGHLNYQADGKSSCFLIFFTGKMFDYGAKNYESLQ